MHLIIYILIYISWNKSSWNISTFITLEKTFRVEKVKSIIY